MFLLLPLVTIKTKVLPFREIRWSAPFITKVTRVLRLSICHHGDKEGALEYRQIYFISYCLCLCLCVCVCVCVCVCTEVVGGHSWNQKIKLTKKTEILI